MKNTMKQFGWWSALFALTLATVFLSRYSAAQDNYQQQDDPPSRVARLGYMEGSVSFQPAGENDWVGAVDNRPMTTGDKLWADKGSRAELQLGSAVIRLSENTGVSFLNLDDHTAQVQLSSGSINIRVRRLDRDDVFEIDTPNLAFSLYQPGSYRLEASEDGTYSVVTIREGDGEATGNGQTYRIHAGQRATFNGTESLNADVEQIGDPDQFDNWAYNRDNRYEHSRSAQYVSNDMVGYDDLDDNGDWRDDSSYGHVWFPHVEAGWAPYREGHWDWIDPWGYTWVDDSSWGYAPFHYGRWVSVGDRWGWVAGPREERAVYAPALVVFVGGGGGGFGGNVGWFPLGPREVYVPSYPVSREYVNRVNISNTTVNTTTVTNVYNTTVINKSTTNVTNVTYVNRNVQGAVTAVPQRAFASAQPVARAAVKMDAREIASAPVTHRVAVNPTRESVLGARAGTANHVTAPPAAVMNRQVIAKTAPPPPPAPFAERQQAMAAHPGQPLPKREVATLRPAPAAEAHPTVKVAPPGKAATPTTGHPNNQPANANNAGRPGQPAPGAPGNQPANRPGNQPAPNERPSANNQPNNRPGQPNNQPGQPNRPAEANQPNNRPGQPANRPPEANQPNNRPGQPNTAQPGNRPPEANQPNNRPGQPNTAQPNNRPPEANQPNNRPGQPNNRPPEANQPNNNRPPENRPPAAQPNNRPSQPENRPPAAEPNRPQPNQPNNRPPEANRPENRPPAAQPNNRPTPPENRPPAAESNRPQPSQPSNRPPAAEPNNRPAQPENRPPAAQPNNRPESARPESNRPAPPPTRNEPPPRQQAPPPSERPQQQHTPPPAAERQAPPPQHQQPKPQTPEEKKKQDQQKPPGI
jgi:hypothetical protein